MDLKGEKRFRRQKGTSGNDSKQRVDEFDA
jgi:hypothetical protein